MKKNFITCVRILCLLLITTTVVCVVFVNIQFNMTGYWLIPTSVSSTFESVKNLIRKGNYTKPDVLNYNHRRLINVYEGVRVKDKVKNEVDTYSRLQSLGNNSEVSEAKDTGESKRHIDILWFNKPSWIDLNFANRVLPSECIYRNCRMSDDTSDIQRYTAIVYTLTHKLDSMPPLTKEERNTDQIWIFFGLESPVNHKHINYRHTSWLNTMNWSMTYRLDSDIFFPYGMLEERKVVPVRNYSAIYHIKTKQAAWLVSNCGAPSKRDDFVMEMKRNGLEVDVFGVCSENKFHKRDDMTTLVNKTYKFYLSFENSLCKDYITEKFFRYYNLDVILVTRGGVDYDHVLPSDTFVDSAYFNSARELVEFLLKVGSSETLYTDFLRRKDKYIASDLFTMTTAYCSMCEKLNNLDKNRKIYADHVTYIHENMCWEPSDIPSLLTRSNFKGHVILTFLFLIPLLSGCILFVYCFRHRRKE